MLSIIKKIMKTHYIKALMISYSILMINIVSCKAQQVYPLNTDYDNVPDNSYLKDINNELFPYVGNYQANYQGNSIVLFITKIDHRFEKRTNKIFYRDALIIKYIVKNSSGTVFQDTQNMILTDQSYFNIYSMRTRPTLNDVTFYYDGTNCGIGWGKIILKKLNATQISWEYIPNSSLIDDDTCPPGTDKTIYLPETKDLIFTKQ